MNEEQYEEVSQNTAIAGQLGQAAQSQAMAQHYLQEQEKGLAETQLEVETIISKIYHLLKQDVLKEQEDGRLDWESILTTKRILTDWAVDKFMQIINFYVNKNTLLSNYNEEQINRLMYRFTTEINDIIFLKYETIFRKLSFKECKDILIQRLDEKAQLKTFALEVAGKVPDEKKIKEDLLEEIEMRIEKEISKIRQEKLKEAIREYGLMTAQLETIILATFNRAWKGEERGSIRRHSQITEVLGNPRSSQQDRGGMFRWLKG